MSTFPTRSTDRDYGRIAWDIVRFGDLPWDEVTDSSRAFWSAVANAVRDAVLADHTADLARLRAIERAAAELIGVEDDIESWGRQPGTAMDLDNRANVHRSRYRAVDKLRAALAGWRTI